MKMKNSTTIGEKISLVVFGFVAGYFCFLLKRDRVEAPDVETDPEGLLVEADTLNEAEDQVAEFVQSLRAAIATSTGDKPRLLVSEQDGLDRLTDDSLLRDV
jgi:hypothetical protein